MRFELHRILRLLSAVLVFWFVALPAAGQCEDLDEDGHFNEDLDCNMAKHDDCDDGDANRFPGNPEVCDESGHDEDCNATTVGFFDGDEDGWSRLCCNDGYCEGRDCNDSDMTTHPATGDFCDGVDNDCDEAVDEAAPPVVSYADVDGDGWGDSFDGGQAMCAGEVLMLRRAVRPGDCNDNEAQIHPGMREACNGLDDDCDGQIDEGLAGICSG